MPEARYSDGRAEKPTTLTLADTGLDGEVLDTEGMLVVYNTVFQEDGIVAGIAVRTPFNVCQLTLEDAVKLRDALNTAIEVNTPDRPEA